MTLKPLLATLAACAVLAPVVACSKAQPVAPRPQSAPTGLYQERYRPQYHFTPARNWMNDPNGLVFYEGEWHLFYQYNPLGNTWGHMSWGHAVSRDLVHWQHLPVALAEENGIMIFSGSAVVDWKNTSGFGQGGRPPLVAIYTGAREGHQAQYLAYSTDRGRSWTKYAGNPVLDIGSGEFRDPKVFWYEPQQKWVMVLVKAMERKVSFYASKDLKQWSHLSDFGPAGAVGGVWECPDLFELPIEGEPGQTRWVLDVDLNPGAIAGGSGGQYFIGHFDGTRFTAEASGSTPALPQGEPVAGFDGADFGGWTATGTAFGSGPATGAVAGQQPVFGFQGRGLANSFHGGDASTGTLTSPEFTLTHDQLALLVGGGSHAQTRVELLVDGQVVRRVSGRDSEALDWVSWDVSGLKGKRARVRAVDEHTGGWGHILLDHVVQVQQPVSSYDAQARWVDYGADFYATISWGDVPASDGRRIWIAWMNNWTYANQIPTSPWRSAQSLPRTVGLKRFADGIRLVQQPVAELKQLRGPATQLGALEIPAGTLSLAERGVGGKALEIVAEFEAGSASEFGLKVRTGAGEETVIGVDAAARRLFVDRSRSGDVSFHPAFAARHSAPLEVRNGRVKLHLFVDWSSVEVFAGDGETVLTNRTFPAPESEGVALYAVGGTARLLSLEAWPLRSAWTSAAR